MRGPPIPPSPETLKEGVEVLEDVIAAAVAGEDKPEN